MRYLLRHAVLGVLVVLVAACGSGGETATGTDESAADAPAEAEQPAEGGVAAMAPEDCQEAAQAMADAVSAVPQALSGGADTAQLQQQVDTLQAVADAAPEEIRADFMLVIDGLASFLRVVADSGWDPSGGQLPPPEALAELQTQAETLSTQEYRDATARVQTWFQDNCGQG